MDKVILFIAIVPDPEIVAEVKAFQEFVSAHFKSHRALRAPPHITLIPPFKWQLDAIATLEEVLTEFANVQREILIRLKNFNAFPPRVVYVDVAANKALETLQANLKKSLDSKLGIKSDRPERPFHPHMTIAFRDLCKQMFRQAWEHFSDLSYQREFAAKKIILLQHSGQRWDERTGFELMAE